MHEAAVDPYDAADGPGRAQGSAGGIGQKCTLVGASDPSDRGLKSQGLHMKALRFDTYIRVLLLSLRLQLLLSLRLHFCFPCGYTSAFLTVAVRPELKPRT